MSAPRIATLSLLAFCIFIGAALPGELSPLAPLVNDWIPTLDHQQVLVWAHVLGYGIAVPIASWALRSLPLGIAAVWALSLLVELMQTFLPYRNGDWVDVAWNVLAVGLGAALSLMLRAAAQRQSAD